MAVVGVAKETVKECDKATAGTTGTTGTAGTTGTIASTPPLPPITPGGSGREAVPETLEGLGRKELQQLCKRCGIKANSKSAVLVKELQAYRAGE
jgi:hypothetical protein